MLLSKVVFLLIITDYYRLISTYTSLSNNIVAVGLLISVMFLIVKKIDGGYRSIFFKKQVFVILCTFLLVPLIINTVSIATFDASIDRLISWTIKTIWFVCFIFFAYLYKDELFSKGQWTIPILLLMLVISFILNSVSPEIFVRIGTTYGVTLSYATYGDIGSRFMGFYLHPNSAAFTLVLILFSIQLYDRQKILYLLPILLMVVLTGSRTALVICIFFSFFYFQNEFIQSKYKFNKNKIVNNFIFLLISTFLILILMFLGLTFADSSLIDRLLNLENIGNDESVMIRTIAQSQYLTLLTNNPVLGYGFDYIRDSIETGRLIKSSHNMYLERIVQYGILGILSFLIFLYYFFKGLRNSLSHWYIIPLLFLYGMFINTFDLILAFYFFLGAVLYRFERIDNENISHNR